MTSPAGGDGVPVCPRHPDRVSYVRCQRCERPVCPQCQRIYWPGTHLDNMLEKLTKAGLVSGQQGEENR